MIVWRGWGILVVLIAAAATAPSAIGAQALLGPELSGFGTALGLAVAGVAVYLIGQRLNAPVSGFHPATGQPVVYRNGHTLFFIPMHYWGFILLAVSVIVTVVTLTKAL